MKKVYICGVRRDLDNIGTGRMELSEIVFDGKQVKEISRYRHKNWTIPIWNEYKRYSL
jgi:hypothetical protein